MKDEYISKRSLLKNFSGIDLTQCQKYGNATAEQQRLSYDTMMLYEIADTIADAPAEDVAPVRHGTWMFTAVPMGKAMPTVSFCSVCNESYILGKQTPEKFCRNFAFCPHCGAKMN